MLCLQAGILFLHPSTDPAWNIRLGLCPILVDVDAAVFCGIGCNGTLYLLPFLLKGSGECRFFVAVVE
jgi:hypothetical protein